MSDTPADLRGQLVAAQRELAELRAQFEQREIAHRTAVEELEINRKALLFMLEDLEAGRKKIENAHREWVAALDGVAEPIFVHDKDFHILRANRAYAQRAGLPVREIIGKPYWDVFPKGAVSPHCRTLLEEALNGGDRSTDEDEITLPSGEIFLCHNFIVRNEQGEYLFSVHVMDDVTERKTAETELLRFNRSLKTLSAGNRTLVYAKDEADLLRSMCDVIVQSGGYRLAWVGYAWQDQNKCIKPVEMRGEGKEYVEALALTWDDVPRGRGPTGTAVRTGQTQVVHDIARDPRCAPWREAALKYGYASSIALPLRENGLTFGALSLYAAEPNAFDANEVALLEELAGDLAFGIVSLRIRNERDRAVEERQDYFDRLRASLEGSLQAIAATVEMRDPYTAGHQRRVAELATAIAEQMMLPQEQAHGIHLAAIVHDLGKIHIPTELLTKPGRLNELEFSFIKIHPQAGFDILKGIDFPWPIAQIVLQHHERLDGSGYPQGLKGDAILLEARILTVADVVEAMSSHRPYRAGLGVEAALEEIVKNRGVFYDAQVVDACLTLFRDENYVFKQ